MESELKRENIQELLIEDGQHYALYKVDTQAELVKFEITQHGYNMLRSEFLTIRSVTNKPKPICPYCGAECTTELNEYSYGFCVCGREFVIISDIVTTYTTKGFDR